ncbi:hypothetical protein [Arthrobacter sp. MA-N2]|uniref:hypothetical protein n=1 Tax=Arthrobacter sp. MA-N2 TaxID=1101188 RepID=UPI0004833C4C|nr:hypothetical protein [Arthrobacter sp. MA-N2]
MPRSAALSILVGNYMLECNEPDRDLGSNWLQHRRDEAHTRRLVAKLEHLGRTVVIDPTA